MLQIKFYQLTHFKIQIKQWVTVQMSISSDVVQ